MVKPVETSSSLKRFVWNLSLVALTWLAGNVYHTGIDQQRQNDDIAHLQSTVSVLSTDMQTLKDQHIVIMDSEERIEAKLDAHRKGK